MRTPSSVVNMELSYIETERGWQSSRIVLHGRNTAGKDVRVTVIIKDVEMYYFGYVVEQFRSAWRSVKASIERQIRNTEEEVK